MGAQKKAKKKTTKKLPKKKRKLAKKTKGKKGLTKPKSNGKIIEETKPGLDDTPAVTSTEPMSFTPEADSTLDLDFEDEGGEEDYPEHDGGMF